MLVAILKLSTADNNRSAIKEDNYEYVLKHAYFSCLNILLLLHEVTPLSQLILASDVWQL